MDPHAAVIEQITMAIAALQDTVHSLNQRIERQQAPQLSALEDSQFDMGGHLHRWHRRLSLRELLLSSRGLQR